MYGWRGKVGLLVPSGNNTNEPDFFRMAPEGVASYASRVYWGEKLESSVEALQEALKHLEAAVIPLMHARVKVMVYACTSGSFIEGAGHDIEIIHRIEKLAGVPALTTTTACLEAMQVLGFRRMAVVTPYPDVVNDRLRAFFEGNGIEVASLETFDQPSVWAHADNSPESIYQMACKAYTDKADGLFISCTQMRAIDVADQLERDLGIPVVAANQASFWAALRRIGLKDRVKGFGRLFEIEELPNASSAQWRKSAKASAGALG